MNSHQQALRALGQALQADNYRFIAPTPLTYSRVLSRARPEGADPLIEAFGWNRPFDDRVLDDKYRKILEQGGLRQKTGEGQLRSLVRFSSLGGMLFAHSGFPTNAPDAVFFGPDTYRFCRAIRWIADHDPNFRPKSVVDVGAGSGVGGLFAAKVFSSMEEIILADINERALQFAQVNAALNDLAFAECRYSDVLANVDQPADLIVSNPPYLVDQSRRTYRHGGGDWGCDLAVRIVEQSLARLTDGGRLLLYTGSPIVRGKDMFWEAVAPQLQRRARRFRYEEIDPDVFGEELGHAPYDRADRIACVVLYVTASDLIG